MLDHSTAPQRSLWPAGPETLTDEYTFRRGQYSVRVKRTGAALLVRRRIAELGLTKEELCRTTGIGPSMMYQLVQAGRIIGEYSETLEKALGIEEGRLHALERADMNNASRVWSRTLERLREETHDVARSAFRGH